MSDYWKLLSKLGEQRSDIAISGDFIVFSRGDRPTLKEPMEVCHNVGYASAL